MAFQLSLPVKMIGTLGLSQAFAKDGRFIDAANRAEIYGDDVFMGMQLPAVLVNQLRQWRVLNAADAVWFRKNLDYPAELQGPTFMNFVNAFISPIRQEMISEPVARRQNAARIRAIIGQELSSMKREARRLRRKGGDFQGTLERRIDDLRSQIKELQGR